MLDGKLQLIISAPAQEPVEAFADEVLEGIVPKLLALSPPRLKVTLTTSEPPRPSLVPYARERVAVLSLGRSGLRGG